MELDEDDDQDDGALPIGESDGTPPSNPGSGLDPAGSGSAISSGHSGGSGYTGSAGSGYTGSAKQYPATGDELSGGLTILGSIAAFISGLGIWKLKRTKKEE
ncbi:MAG: LPXTG cell wall anchor domain-containing protein [Enterococcus sp.]|uniref:LPXTG cell wall anchor domain-containing protein n=1 Tax=Enterococcus sp. TaxID=35783 RepID=UPI002648A891|nr:LPXTG cell wall anchor domain-containing protein [Enterococcus sp.]MDN6647639.1 LPXTG cell wall anchor domain-containing protein [Enterococcus sp.]MDN6691940.1 LPXTG cell wall anchor domain-containing protein [Enterococcus sp.]